MFLKTTRAGGYEYLKLVESRRENGKPKHRVLVNFGRADIIKKDESFLRAMQKLCEIMGIAAPAMTDDDAGLFEECTGATLHNYGYLAYLKLWRELGLKRIIEDLQAGCTKTQFRLNDSAFLMAVQHLLEPMSKLATHQRQGRYFNYPGCMGEQFEIRIPQGFGFRTTSPVISLHHMYRTLDKLSELKTDIESELFSFNYTRVNQQVEVVFYDVTTFAFESTTADDLRDFGFSKDCKFSEVQVVMGMIIDTNGMPVGYELFPGNTFDGKTMLKALENIRKRYGIRRVVIVADRGLNSKGNLNLIKEAGYGYIMAGKIKSMSTRMKESILSPEGFVSLTDDNGDEYRYKTLEYTYSVTDEAGITHCLDENLIISYSSKRAKKDARDRERLVEKAKSLLATPGSIGAKNKRGGKKYIEKANPKQKDTWILDEEKIREDSRFDGYMGIQTSEKHMTPNEIMEAYHTLWKIEESFRIMKSTMEVRPIFHWTTSRIEGHFVVCFLAFAMERKLELLLAEHHDEVAASPDRIREALNTMQLAAIATNDDTLYVKIKPLPLALKIFRLLKINMPQNINMYSELHERFDLHDKLPDYCQLCL